MIDISNVSKIFKTKNQNITAVDNVELNVKAGEIFGVIGYSGAGKSTLIRLLNGLEQPSEGTVTVTWSGNSVSWYNYGVPAYQCNDSNQQYCYIALIDMAE